MICIADVMMMRCYSDENGHIDAVIAECAEADKVCSVALHHKPFTAHPVSCLLHRAR